MKILLSFFLTLLDGHLTSVLWVERNLCDSEWGTPRPTGFETFRSNEDTRTGEVAVRFYTGVSP